MGARPGPDVCTSLYAGVRLFLSRICGPDYSNRRLARLNTRASEMGGTFVEKGCSVIRQCPTFALGDTMYHVQKASKPEKASTHQKTENGHIIPSQRSH